MSRGRQVEGVPVAMCRGPSIANAPGRVDVDENASPNVESHRCVGSATIGSIGRRALGASMNRQAPHPSGCDAWAVGDD